METVRSGDMGLSLVRKEQLRKGGRRATQLRVLCENAIFCYLSDAEGDLLEHSRREDVVFQAIKIARQRKVGR